MSNNSFDCKSFNETEQTARADSPWTVDQIIWTFCFSLILVTSILGNTIVLWIILAHRAMWSVTNYFLVNLTAADLMMSIFNCIPSFIFMRDRYWIFGSVYCTLNNFVSYLSVSCSVFTLLAISVDRRKAIVRPLAPKTGKTFVIVTIILIWVGSAVLASPAVMFSKTVQVQECSEQVACILIWPDGYQGTSPTDYLYNIIFFLVTYLFPMLGMMLCYLQMGINLWRSDPNSNMSCITSHPAIVKSRQNKKRLVKMFAVVVTIFMVCWAPYHIYFIYSYHDPNITKIPYINHIYLAFYWLAMSNTCVNPIIYYWMNKRFRAYFDMIFFCLPRYLKRATSNRWPLDDTFTENSLTRITRTQSCPAGHHRQLHRKYGISHRGKTISTIPVRAIGLRQSESFDLADTETGAGGGAQSHRGLSMSLYRSVTFSTDSSSSRQSMKQSIRSRESEITNLDIPEETF